MWNQFFDIPGKNCYIPQSTHQTFPALYFLLRSCDNCSPLLGGSEFHEFDLHLLEEAAEHEPEKETEMFLNK